MRSMQLADMFLHTAKHICIYIHTTVTDHKKRESLTIRLRAVAPVVVIVAVVDIVVDISGKKSNSCAVVVVVVSFVIAAVSVAVVVVVASASVVVAVAVAVTSSSSSGAFVVVAAPAFVVGCVLIVRSSLTFIVAVDVVVVTLCTNFVSFYISYTMHKFTCATRLSLCSLSLSLFLLTSL